MINSEAIFSKDRVHRYLLIREWDLQKPILMFIGLNPSTADETNDDPTVRRFIGYAKRWGYGKIYVTNAFAFRATDPQDLFSSKDPLGPENDFWIKKISPNADKVILAYGNHGNFLNRHDKILSLIKNHF